MLQTEETIKVTRPALRYFGGKFRLSKWIIPYLPEHETYVEPFGGAMGVLLNKRQAHFEVYNDLDGQVVNFFRVLRDQPDAFIRAVQLTPYSREEQLVSFNESEDVSDLEKARRLYVRCWQSHGGGRTQWRSGWRYQINNNRGRSTIDDWNETDHLWAIVNRLKDVQFECDDARRVLKRYDKTNVLYYLDPPYVASTRSIRWNKKAYTFELDDAVHEEVLEIACQLKGMVAISGKPSELYNKHLGDWTVLQKTVPTDFQSMTVECLWLSPQLVERQKQMRMDL